MCINYTGYFFIPQKQCGIKQLGRNKVSLVDAAGIDPNNVTLPDVRNAAIKQNTRKHKVENKQPTCCPITIFDKHLKGERILQEI